MTLGDIVLIPFPFAELDNIKIRPSAVLAATKDKYKDLIICAISSVVPVHLNECDIFIEADARNNLRTDSIIKVDRITTISQSKIITVLGKLYKEKILELKTKFISLVD